MLLALAAAALPAAAAEPAHEDLLGFARGAIPVAVEGAASLGVGMEQALRAIDGDPGVYVLTPKPGDAQSAVAFVYELPALTTFSGFAVPNVLETPSPSQTFVRKVDISGSRSGPGGPFEPLAGATLATHAGKGQVTELPAAATPVRWIRVALEGGIHVERDRTFLEFSEIAGYGTQEKVPLSQAFNGFWKGRGTVLALVQDGVRVSGCYDGEGELTGTVGGNLLFATGTAAKSGVPSTFVLAAGPGGAIRGVRSTNGAPFKLYEAQASSVAKATCVARPVVPIGCGATLHGIGFDYDSATLRPDSAKHLDALASGLKASAAGAVTVIGHTSSEGETAYNERLSERRAQAVAAAVVARGIDAARISAAGRGETQPIADNATEAGRALNRRVEIACR